MKVSKAARIAALVVGVSGFAAPMPAIAQQSQPAAQPTPEQQQADAALQRRFRALSRAESRVIAPLVNANVAANQAKRTGQTPDWAAVRALLPAAQAAARSNEAKYFVAQVQLGLAIEANDAAAQEQLLAALVANPVLTPTELTSYRNGQKLVLRNRARVAFDASDFATAERILLQVQQLDPTDASVTNDIAVIRGRLGNTDGALAPTLAQITAAETNGGRATEDLYRRARDTYYRARNAERTAEFAAKLAQNYPTATNWRDAIRIYREFGQPTNEASLVAYRLQRAANAFESQAEYADYIRLVRNGGFAGEAKAAIDAGTAARLVNGSNPEMREIATWATTNIATERTSLERETREAVAGNDARQALAMGNALYGYGRYAEAADVFRATLTKTGANRDVVNLNLGAALAMANRRADAEAALHAVTGPSAGVAKLWLAWLARNQG